jgi:hypothetical protein
LSHTAPGAFLFSAEKGKDFPGSFTALFTRYIWLYRPVDIASAKIVILGLVLAKPSFVVLPEVFSEHRPFLRRRMTLLEKSMAVFTSQL